MSLSLSLSSNDRPIDLSIYRSIYRSIYLSASLKTKLFCETCSVFKPDNIKNAAIQRDFLNFCTEQHQKQSTSARLPTCFKVNNIKNERILRDFLQKWKVECRADGLVPMRFAIFPCACHKKVMPGHTKCCTYHAKSSQQTWRSEAPKCNPSQEISARTS